MTRFSVIIPTYNRRDYLLDCLETVFAQSYAPYEVIVVDDGSTDGTIEAVEKFGRGVQVIKQANVGPGAARNRGASIASGDYLAFLDSDDLWFPWTLTTFASLIEQHGRPSLLFGKFVDFTDKRQLISMEIAKPMGAIYPDFFSSHAENHFCGAGMMVVSRKEFKFVSGFEEDFFNAEDHDLALQLGTARGFVAVLQPVTIGHRLHDGNETDHKGKTVAGLRRLIQKERRGIYPGGNSRSFERKEIITRHLRPEVVSAIKNGRREIGWSLYCDTFLWNFRLMRMRYLFGVLIITLLQSLPICRRR